jgi:uncharacterized protein (TIGR02118 family)
MLKLVCVVHKRAGMSTDDFRQYWLETHGPIAAKIPGLRKYTQVYAHAGPDGSSPPFDGLAELWFDDESALEAAMASPEIGAASADNKNFLDEERLQIFVAEEVPMALGG